jgi:predicted glycoside hydrolase/deacetylase ChbG (UPF0249 family)
MDEDGYFYHQSERVQEAADAAAVQVEVQAQVDRALAAGIDLTHIDTHMGAVANLRLIPTYVQTAMRYQLPAMVPRLDEAGYVALGVDAEMAAYATEFVLQLEAQGMPLLDNLVALPLDEEPEDRLAVAKRTFDGLSPGLTHVIIHPAKDSPELRAITPRWRSRVADYEAFSSTELKNYVRDAGIQVIGYRALRELMRSSSE